MPQVVMPQTVELKPTGAIGKSSLSATRRPSAAFKTFCPAWVYEHKARNSAR
jgi:hypothetical protein